MYCNAIAAGGAAEWEFALEQFKVATIAIEADKLRAALACTKQPWLLNRSAHPQPLILLYSVLHSGTDLLTSMCYALSSGTWSTLLCQTLSESRMPPLPLSTLPTMWLVSLWPGTLSGHDGLTFSTSEYNTVPLLPQYFYHCYN